MIKNAIAESLKKVIEKKYNLPDTEPSVTESPNKQFGDYSTQIAFQLAKILKNDPKKIASDLKDAIEGNAFFEKVEVVGGYINFFLKNEFYHKEIERVFSAGEEYGKLDNVGEEKILVEYVSSNPTGPMVIVNGRAAALGDSLVKILNWRGYQAISEFYINDGGNQVYLLGISCNEVYKKLNGFPYEIPENGYHGEYIDDFVRAISKNTDLSGMDDKSRSDYLGSEGVRYFHSMQIESLRNFGVEFDSEVHEKRIREENLPEYVLNTLKEKGLLYENEGATFFKSTQFGDDKDRAIIKKNGEYTYLLPDAAYHEDKVRRNFEYLIDIFGPDHHGYIKRLKAIFKALGHDPNRLEILIHQIVNLVNEGEKIKMSKRKGQIITLDDLIGDVGKDPARFFFVMRKKNAHLDFDMKLAKEKSENNPVFYVQYAHARISSILKFADSKGINIDNYVDFSLLNEEKEIELIKMVLMFPDALDDVIRIREPAILPKYLIDLASAFHSFYNKHRVITENIELSQARLALVQCVKNTIKIGLSLIGVSSPEQM